MNKEFIPYEQALELKKLGFKEECFGEWQNLKSGKNLVVDEEYDRKYDIPVLAADIRAPLYQQAFRWFREKHSIHYYIDITIEDKWFFCLFNLASKRNAEIVSEEPTYYNTYEEAEDACLIKLIEIVKGVNK